MQGMATDPPRTAAQGERCCVWGGGGEGSCPTPANQCNAPGGRRSRGRPVGPPGSAPPAAPGAWPPSPRSGSHPSVRTAVECVSMSPSVARPHANATTQPIPHTPDESTAPHTGRSVMTAMYSGPETWLERCDRPSCCTKLVELKGISKVMCTRRRWFPARLSACREMPVEPVFERESVCVCGCINMCVSRKKRIESLTRDSDNNLPP